MTSDKSSGQDAELGGLGPPASLFGPQIARPGPVVVTTAIGRHLRADRRRHLVDPLSNCGKRFTLDQADRDLFVVGNGQAPWPWGPRSGSSTSTAPALTDKPCRRERASHRPGCLLPGHPLSTQSSDHLLLLLGQSRTCRAHEQPPRFVPTSVGVLTEIVRSPLEYAKHLQCPGQYDRAWLQLRRNCHQNWWTRLWRGHYCKQCEVAVMAATSMP